MKERMENNTTRDPESASIIALVHADAFLPVVSQDEAGNTAVFYGGDQAWFKNKVGRYSGCGAVAAADIFAYKAMHNPDFKSLFENDDPEITVDRFLEHMNAVIKYVAPLKVPYTDIPYGGLTSLPRFTRYGETYAASRGVKLKGHYLGNKELNLEGAIAKLEEQLARDNPVALLIMQNRKLKHVEYTDAHGKPVVSDMRFHWVVITSIQKAADKVTVVVSSEGGKAVLDFTDVWMCDNGMPTGWRGIVYFDTAESH